MADLSPEAWSAVATVDSETATDEEKEAARDEIARSYTCPPGAMDFTPGSPRGRILGKECGTCSLCCKTTAVPSMQKKPFDWCKACKPGTAKPCSIYETRPDECKTWNCMWLGNDSDVMPDWLRPDRCHIVFYMELPKDDGGDNPYRVNAEVDPGYPTAWQEPRMAAFLADVARTLYDAMGIAGSLIIQQRATRTYVGHNGQLFQWRVQKERDSATVSITLREMETIGWLQDYFGSPRTPPLFER